MKDIQIQFAIMTERIKQALIDNKVEVDKLINQLCTISAVKNKKVPIFDNDVFERIKSINELWKTLRNFWKIFDYELLEYVVGISECEQARTILKQFLAEIDPSAIKGVNLVLHCVEENQEGALEPVLRVKVNTEECTADIEEQVKKTISKKFNLDQYALHLCGIKEGCIELLYYISKPLKTYLMKCIISEDIIEEFLANKNY